MLNLEFGLVISKSVSVKLFSVSVFPSHMYSPAVFIIDYSELKTISRTDEKFHLVCGCPERVGEMIK